MAGIGDYILKIMKKLDDLEKKIDRLAESLDVKVDLTSRD